tara:strand:+ start:1498 stop:1950 length:453 start_codon:yes stop_codon:yes gene_type:complete
MANTSAVCTSFKVELLKGEHNFTNSTGDTFKIALFDSDATLGAGTTGYSTSEEITNTSGTAYTAGGAALTNVTPTSSSTTAYTDFSDVSWTDASFTANAALIYNTTTGTGTGTTDSVCAIAFGGDKTATSGTFTIQFPTADASNAILRIA